MAWCRPGAAGFEQPGHGRRPGRVRRSLVRTLRGCSARSVTREGTSRGAGAHGARKGGGARAPIGSGVGHGGRVVRACGVSVIHIGVCVFVCACARGVHVPGGTTHEHLPDGCMRAPGACTSAHTHSYTTRLRSSLMLNHRRRPRPSKGPTRTRAPASARAFACIRTRTRSAVLDPAHARAHLRKRAVCCGENTRATALIARASCHFQIHSRPRDLVCLSVSAS